MTALDATWVFAIVRVDQSREMIAVEMLTKRIPVFIPKTAAAHVDFADLNRKTALTTFVLFAGAQFLLIVNFSYLAHTKRLPLFFRRVNLKTAKKNGD